MFSVCKSGRVRVSRSVVLMGRADLLARVVFFLGVCGLIVSSMIEMLIKESVGSGFCNGVVEVSGGETYRAILWINW